MVAFYRGQAGFCAGGQRITLPIKRPHGWMKEYSLNFIRRALTERMRRGARNRADARKARARKGELVEKMESLKRPASAG